MSDIARYADVAMYRAQDQAPEPKVTLVQMTRNPVRTMAAACGLYKGEVYHSPHDVPAVAAREWFLDMNRTALKAGLEFIDLHFLIEGVTRAFTHQMVRQRTAVYVQESMRFAVKENAAMEVAVPPSLAGLAEDDPRMVVWKSEVYRLSETYNRLINAGVPAEDARGLLPTNITTRIHYKTNLRGLAEHAGYRLCTQAQFEWRQVWMGIIHAIRDYPFTHDSSVIQSEWEYRMVADMFRPICYRTGKCEFMGTADRACSIRDRVQAHAAKGEPSTEWTDIQPSEWMLDPAAARRSA